MFPITFAVLFICSLSHCHHIVLVRRFSLEARTDMSDAQPQLDHLKGVWELCKAQDNQKQSLISVWKTLESLANYFC